MSKTTKVQIILAASTLMSDRSTNSVSLRDIAVEANVSKALVLKYFGSKSNLIIETLEYERVKIEDMWADVNVDTSVEDLCLRLLTAFQVNPRYFKLITRMTLDDTDEQIQSWLRERFIYGRIQKVIERLQEASGDDRQFRNWSPEAFGVFAMVCSFALPVLGPKVMDWYRIPDEQKSHVEQEVLLLCINALVSNIENK